MSNRRHKAKLDRRAQLAIGRQMATAYEDAKSAELPAEVSNLLAKLHETD